MIWGAPQKNGDDGDSDEEEKKNAFGAYKNLVTKENTVKQGWLYK